LIIIEKPKNTTLILKYIKFFGLLRRPASRTSRNDMERKSSTPSVIARSLQSKRRGNPRKNNSDKIYINR